MTPRAAGSRSAGSPKEKPAGTSGNGLGCPIPRCGGSHDFWNHREPPGTSGNQRANSDGYLLAAHDSQHDEDSKHD